MIDLFIWTVYRCFRFSNNYFFFGRENQKKHVFERCFCCYFLSCSFPAFILIPLTLYPYSLLLCLRSSYIILSFQPQWPCALSICARMHCICPPYHGLLCLCFVYAISAPCLPHWRPCCSFDVSPCQSASMLKTASGCRRSDRIMLSVCVCVTAFHLPPGGFWEAEGRDGSVAGWYGPQADWSGTLLKQRHLLEDAPASGTFRKQGSTEFVHGGFFFWSSG